MKREELPKNLRERENLGDNDVNYFCLIRGVWKCDEHSVDQLSLQRSRL